MEPVMPASADPPSSFPRKREAMPRAPSDRVMDARLRGHDGSSGGIIPRVVRVGAIEIANDRPFVLIAGPCQIESRAHALEVAAALREMSDATGVKVIYKSSFDKANRTSAAAARGVGIAPGLAILAEVR